MILGLTVAQLICATATAQNVHRLSCATPGAIYALPPDGGSVEFSTEANETAWIVVEERGQDVDIEANAQERIEAQVPPRYGLVALEVQYGASIKIRRTQVNRAYGNIMVRLSCVLDPRTFEWLAWFRRAAPLISRARATQSAAETDVLLPELISLRDAAPDRRASALAQHAIAQALYSSGRSAGASEAFAKAEEAWRSIGDPERTLIARVGRVEDLYRAGQYGQVLRLSTSVSGASAGSGYFSLRLRNDRCTALHALGQERQARDCFRWTLGKLAKLDERVEYASTLQSLAAVEQVLANFDAATQLARRALAFAQGPQAPIVRGRIHLLLASIAASQGIVSDTLEEANAALEQFVIDGGARWQANTLITLAQVYTELGTYDEAYVAIAGAFSHLSAKDAKARIAIALMALASIDRLNHRTKEALHWTSEAQSIFQALRQAPDYERARLGKIRLLLDEGSIDAARAALLSIPKADILRDPDASLAAAELALHELSLPEARLYLAASKKTALTLSQEIWRARLWSTYWTRLGNRLQAMRSLDDARRRIDALVKQSRNAIVQYLLSRLEHPLQVEAYATILAGESADGLKELGGPTSAQEMLWSWLTMPTQTFDHAGEDLSYSSGAANLSSFDSELIDQLLPSLPRSKTRRSASAEASELARVLSQGRSNPKSANREVSRLKAFQASLSEDAVAMAYLDAGDRGAVLWITPTSIRIFPAVAPNILRDQVAILNVKVRSAATPIADIDSVSARVSGLLWAAVPEKDPPRRLLVLHDPITGAIPWSILRWPGRDLPLVGSTAVTVLISAGGSYSATLDASPELTTIVASGKKGGALARLSLAEIEPRLIRDALSRSDVTIAPPLAATRELTLAAFGRSRAWVHVSAHGAVRAGRLGYSGIWFEPPGEGSAPHFLSWLDAMEHGSAADLIVLNVCQLGDDNGSIANSTSSFATALVLSGAHVVVAALWPVSDSASAIWVPAFYSSLAGRESRDASQALRHAQERLRRSRAFRHPYYWASLGTFAR